MGNHRPIRRVVILNSKIGDDPAAGDHRAPAVPGAAGAFRLHAAGLAVIFDSLLQRRIGRGTLSDAEGVLILVAIAVQEIGW